MMKAEISKYALSKISKKNEQKYNNQIKTRTNKNK